MYVPSERGITEASQTGGTKTKSKKKKTSDIPESTTRGVKPDDNLKDTDVSKSKSSGPSHPIKPNPDTKTMMVNQANSDTKKRA